MSSNQLPQLETEEHPPLELLRQYQAHTLPDHLHHQIERHLLSCDLCSDLVEGMTVTPPRRVQKAVKETRGRLKKLIQAKKRKKRTFLLPVWQTAAVIIVVLLCIAFAFYQQYQIQNLKKRPGTTHAAAQAIQVSGHVVNPLGEAVAGALVLSGNQDSLGVTDAGGGFHVTLPAGNTSLLIQHPRFTVQEVPVDTSAFPLQITLTYE
ncbi:carboxypeptidase-like regulatory domain-containing protein [Rufibacter quisquiliarum]|uniref:Zinc-finger domain-containing protein n=1 Tax=Rufibacter quisquiliarum TaxID=1549639 RepID=A0A839GQV0_9BACT|nr:carboxypeptidase-like regulatory domain-containing protein [Rufibacter quisquiliarum]MBA9079209.1 hypothetical protein [Rufibacter quisquiliarum]